MVLKKIRVKANMEEIKKLGEEERKGKNAANKIKERAKEK